MSSRRAAALAVGAVALVTLAACGSSSGSSSGGSAGASSAGPSSGTATMQRFPGVTGTIAAVSSGTLQVQNPQSGQTAVTYTSSTPVTATVSAIRAALVAGKCATVLGSGATQTVTISTPQNGSCARGFGGRGAGGTGGGPSTPRARPSGAPNGRFGGASGTVSAVTPTSFVVTRSNANGGTMTSTVTTTATTVYTQTTTATDSALRVGQCLTAIGRTGDTGAVAATSLAVRAPGPQGCTTGFRGAGTGAGGQTGGSQ